MKKMSMSKFFKRFGKKFGKRFSKILGSGDVSKRKGWVKWWSFKKKRNWRRKNRKKRLQREQRDNRRKENPKPKAAKIQVGGGKIRQKGYVREKNIIIMFF